MATIQKYQVLTRDKHDVLWTSKIYQEGTEGTFVNNYGLLYNWYAATDSRNICAPGWHILSLTEFNTLITSLGGADIAGGKLKETGYNHWTYPNYGADNSSGFTGRGAGFRTSAFFQLKEVLDIWFSTEYDAGRGYMATAACYQNGASATGSNSKYFGFSLRPIKDDSILTGYTGNDGKNYNTIKIGAQVLLVGNLCETKYRNGDLIPEVTLNSAWEALTTGALCAYDNNWSNAFDQGYIDLIGAGNEPLQIEMTNESDDLFDQFKSSRAKISVWSYSMFAFADLYSSQEMSNVVKIFQGVNLYWSGYVDPGGYQEPYGPVPYQTDIYCTDGLSLLEDIIYEESEGVRYNGRRLESQIILDILGKIGFTEFKEFINIYATGIYSGVGDSPMDQLLIDVDIFENMTCDEVFKEILKKYGACIRQVNGIFCIYKPIDLNKATVYGRYFTGATAKTPITLTPIQYIRRSDHQTEFLEVKPGIVMVQSQVKKVIIRQDYGNKESWLDNYQFKSNTYSRITWKFEYWEHEGDVTVGPVSDFIPGETEGCMFTTHNPTGQHIKCIYQENFGANAIITNDNFRLSFEYMFYNNGVTLVEDAMFWIEIKNIAGTRWLKATTNNNDIDNITWETILSYIVIKADSPPGITDWMTFERKIPGLPVNGGFIIKIYASYIVDITVFAAIKNIKLYTTGSAISQKSSKQIIPHMRKNFFNKFLSLFGAARWRVETIYVFSSETKRIVEHEYSATNSVNGKNLEYNCILGDVGDTEIDNISEQFAGSLIKSSDMFPTYTWNTRGGSENKPLLQIIADEIAMQYNGPKQFLDLPILEITKAVSALNLLGSFQDSINIVNNHLRVFVINRGTFNIKYRSWKFDLIEIGYGESTGGIPGNALLNENGEPILNENGDYILTGD